MICGDCKHWNGDNQVERAPCKRFPPNAGGVVMTQGLSGPQPMILWACPDTARGDYCGEWAIAEPKLRLA